MRRWYLAVALFGVLATGQSALAVRSAGAGSSDVVDPSCSRYSVPVSLGPGQPASYRIAAWLCGHTPGGTVQVLVSGTTYNHSYWDFPLEPQTYSYVHALTSAGLDVLNVDRIGIGESSHPPAALSSGFANAWVVHTLVQDLRAGRIGGSTFDKVVLVGHSQGSAIILGEAATYQDVDGLIVTGLPAIPAGPSAPLTVASLYPAQLDPKFAAANIPPGYTTTRPGTRAAVFYYAPTADPAVIAEDEVLKDVFPAGEGSILLSYAQTRSIHVPVLSMTGEFDNFFCTIPCSNPDSPAMVEQPHLYSSGTCLVADVLPAAGHDINLHPDAPEWFATAASWTREWIGDGPASPPTHSCPGATSP